MAEMDLPDIDLEDRVVIMTGADRGLGRAMSGLAKKGARLVSPVMDGLNARWWSRSPPSPGRAGRSPSRPTSSLES